MMTGEECDVDNRKAGLALRRTPEAKAAINGDGCAVKGGVAALKTCSRTPATCC